MDFISMKERTLMKNTPTSSTQWAIDIHAFDDDPAALALSERLLRSGIAYGQTNAAFGLGLACAEMRIISLDELVESLTAGYTRGLTHAEGR